MTTETDRFTKREFVNIAWEQLQKPIFHQNAIYAFAHRGDKVDTFKATVGPSGEAVGLHKLDLGTTPVEGSWNSMATCAYRGRIYMFYDSVRHDDRWKFGILYKTTASPDEGWLPVSGKGHETGLVGRYTNWGLHGTVPGCIAAKELNDKIYVIYHYDDQIHYGTFDGATWKYMGKVSERKYHPNINVCLAHITETPAIIIGGFTHDDQRSMSPIALCADGRILDMRPFYLDWAQPNNMIGLAQGTIQGGVQDNVLQVFCNNSGSRNDLRRTTYGLESGARGEWVDTTIDGMPKRFSFCDTVTVSVPQGAGEGHFRQFVVVLTFRESHGGGSHDPMKPVQTFASYPSDFFRCDHTSEVVYTGSQSTVQPDAWTLLGVIEGVPPFTRNGVDSREKTASVEYGESVTRKVTITQGFETAVSGTIGTNITKAFSVSVEQAATFGASNVMAKTIKQDVDITLSNEQRNAEGGWGGLVVSKPHLLGRRYSRYTHDQKYLLGTFYLVRVEDVSITLEPYDLAKPLPGMLERKPSSDLKYWGGVTLPPHSEVELFRVRPATATLTGGIVRGSLWVGEATTRKIETSAKTTLKASLGNEALDKLFKLEGSASLSFKYTNEVTSEFSQKIVANLKLLDPGAGRPDTVTRLEIQPLWQIAKEGARLNPDQKPYWLPNDYIGRGAIPWCLSWRVLDARRADGVAVVAPPAP